MERDFLPHLPVILAVARRRSFSAAAAELGLSASTVSHLVRLVEDRLGTPLFARTTRAVALTEAGAAFVAAVAPALEDITAGWDQARSGKAGAAGLLRLNMSRIVPRLGVAAIIAAMNARYPDVTIEIGFDEGLSDIVGAGYDAGVRLGEMIAEDMVAVPLTPPMRAILAAAPDYLARRGAPRHLADLERHDCIGFRQVTGGGLYRWDVTEEGRDLKLAVPSRLIVNDTLAAIDLALAGAGIVYGFEPLLRDAIAAGRLTQVLPEIGSDEPGMYLYFPRRASLAPKLRAFVDTARLVLKAETTTARG